MAAMAVVAAASTTAASAQTRYFARERLAPGAASTPSNGTGSGSGATVTIKCAARIYQHWAANYNSRPSTQIGRVGPGVNAEALCQNYASGVSNSGVCAVSTASADPDNPGSGYMMLFYPGDSTLFKDGPAFASEYAMSCVKQ